MQLIMNDDRYDTIEQVKQFLEGSNALEFRGCNSNLKDGTLIGGRPLSTYGMSKHDTKKNHR